VEPLNGLELCGRHTPVGRAAESIGIRGEEVADLRAPELEGRCLGQEADRIGQRGAGRAQAAGERGGWKAVSSVQARTAA
jgi:hypothetical protein